MGNNFKRQGRKGGPRQHVGTQILIFVLSENFLSKKEPGVRNEQRS